MINQEQLTRMADRNTAIRNAQYDHDRREMAMGMALLRSWDAEKKTSTVQNNLMNAWIAGEITYEQYKKYSSTM